MKFTLTQSLIATVGMGNAIRNFLKCNVRVVYIFCCLLDNKNIKTNKEDMMKKIVTLGILMICLLVAVRMTTFANAESIILILGMNTSFREVPVMSGHPGECGELERCGHIVRILATMQQVSYRRECIMDCKL